MEEARQKSAVMVTVPSGGSLASRLLSLPPEIRNMIYRFVLVEGNIHMRPGNIPEQPGLLQVNTQIRRETLRTYYQENHFNWHIWAFDARECISWCQSSSDRRYSSIRSWTLEGPRNWSNLLNWIEASHGSKVRWVDQAAVTSRGRVAARFFKLSGDMAKQNLPWAKIKENLNVTHEMLCIVSHRWLNQKDSL